MRLGIVLILSIITTASLAQRRTRGKRMQPKTPEVSLVTSELSTVYDELNFGGFIQASSTRMAAPEVTGTIEQIYQQPGSMVKRGQKLFAIKPKGATAGFQLHIVSSPLSGIVARRLKDLGDFVQAGDPVLEVADPSDLVIEFQAGRGDLPHLSPATKLNLLDPSAKVIAMASVQFVAPAADPETRTHLVRAGIKCDPCGSELRLGQFTEISLPTNPRQAIMLPIKTLREQRRVVYTLDKDSILTRHKIETGRSQDGLIEIISGLTPGLRVVMYHTGHLKDGSKAIVKDITAERKKLLENLDH